MKGIILTMLSAIAFGFAFTLGPMTYGDGGSNPTTLTFLRNALSLPVLFLILRYQGISLAVTGKELLSLTILGGIGNAFTTLLLFISFSLIDVGIATTIHFIYPVFVTIGCVLFFKEKLGFKKVVSLLVATCGIACFFFGVDTSQGLRGGMILGLALAVISGVLAEVCLDGQYMLLSQYEFRRARTSLLTGVYGTATGDLTLSTLTPKSWGISLAFSLLCTVIALSLLQIGIKYVGASTAAILTTFEPITSIVCGVILLGETITTVKIIACSLIMIGVVMLSLAKENKNGNLSASES